MEELVFKYVPIEISLVAPFGLFTRGHDTVVAMVRDKQGRWILGRKDNFYPEGIVRMVGGGMDDGNPLADIRREVEEELGVSVDDDRFHPLIHAEIIGALPDGGQCSASVFVFYTAILEPVTASDDLSGLAYYTDGELVQLVERYGRLSDDIVVRRNDQSRATWADYGHIWGPIHAAALERVKELGL